MDNVEEINEFNIKKIKNDFRKLSNIKNKVFNSQKYNSLSKHIDNIGENIDEYYMVSEKYKEFTKQKKTLKKNTQDKINSIFNETLRDVYQYYRSLLSLKNFRKFIDIKSALKIKNNGDLLFNNEFGEWNIGKLRKPDGSSYVFFNDFNNKEHKFTPTKFKEFMINFIFNNYIFFSDNTTLENKLKEYLNKVGNISIDFSEKIDTDFLSRLVEVSLGKKMSVALMKGYKNIYNNLTNAAKKIKSKSDISKILNNIKKTHTNSLKKITLQLNNTEKHLRDKSKSSLQKYKNSVNTYKNSKKYKSWKRSHKL